jgi:hypothetical protein
MNRWWMEFPRALFWRVIKDVREARTMKKLNRSSKNSSNRAVARCSLYSDFEGTIVLPEISYKDWVLPMVKDQNRFLEDYRSRLENAREKRTTEAWRKYLDLYVGLFRIRDFVRVYAYLKIFPEFYERIQFLKLPR